VVHVNIAGFRQHAGEYEEALKGYERAVEIDPGFALGYAQIADLYENAFGRFEEAIHWSERAVASDPGNLTLQLIHGLRLQKLGRFDDAMEVYREAIDLAPGNIAGYAGIANLHETRGRLDEAIRWTHEAHRRDPSNALPMFQLAGFYFVLGDEAAGRLWLTRLQDQGGTFWSEYIQALAVHVQRGELAKAEAFFQAFASQDPRGVFEFDLDAGNYDSILEREAALEPGLFEDRPEVNVGNVEAAMRVGAALAGRGDHLRAERILGRCEESLLGLDETLRRVRFPDLLASVYLFQGRNDDALNEWRTAFENGWNGTGTDPNREWWFIDAPFAKFDPVRDDPRFRALVDDMRADLDRQRRALEREGLAIKQ
jgi:tetratricopeptide (TPR) repeat protein